MQRLCKGQTVHVNSECNVPVFDNRSGKRLGQVTCFDTDHFIVLSDNSSLIKCMWDTSSYVFIPRKFIKELK